MDILLPMHIGAGIVALVASLLAVVSAKGKKLHIRSGRIYFLGMLGIFITAIPIHTLHPHGYLGDVITDQHETCLHLIWAVVFGVAPRDLDRLWFLLFFAVIAPRKREAAAV